MKSVTCTAPVNIAVVKYWGKRDEKLILPINSSLSGTLDQAQLRAKTTAALSPSFTEDQMWLNGQKQSIDSPRLQKVLQEIRHQAKQKQDSGSKDDLIDCHVHICSENNFPTAAGLASSAAGYACLVYTLAKLFNVEGEISVIARQGSGSACRSIYGGFVAWDMGVLPGGSDSIARQVCTENHWQDMRILILVVSDQKKLVGSTAGMQTSVHTSALLKLRSSEVVPARMEALTQAILKRDFHTFAEETMKDSNQFHAVCLDTYPPISYMTDTSRDIIRLVHAINKHAGINKVAYTFDAGPNACLYLLEESVPLVLGLVQHYFPSTGDSDHFIQGPPVKKCQPPQALLETIPVQKSFDSIKYIIHTKVGPGPQVLDDKESLLGPDGMPLILTSK